MSINNPFTTYNPISYNPFTTNNYAFWNSFLPRTVNGFGAVCCHKQPGEKVKLTKIVSFDSSVVCRKAQEAANQAGRCEASCDSISTWRDLCQWHLCFTPFCLHTIPYVELSNCLFCSDEIQVTRKASFHFMLLRGSLWKIKFFWICIFITWHTKGRERVMEIDDHDLI